MRRCAQIFKFDLLFNNAPLFAIVTTLFWAGNTVAGKFAIGHVSPLMLTMCRWFVVVAVMLVLGWRHVRADWEVIRQNAIQLFLCGALGFAVFNGLYYCALNFTTAINVSILQAAMPMFVFALNFLLFRFPMHWAHGVGYSITLIGVLLVAAQGNLRLLSDLSLNLGDALILIAVGIYAAYSVSLRAKPDMHWISFMTVLSVAAAIASVPMAVMEYYLGSAIPPMTVTSWAIVFYTALFPSIISQSLWVLTNERLGANTASLFLNLVPIFGALLAVIFLSEAFYAYHAAALAMVITGIVLAQVLTAGPRQT